MGLVSIWFAAGALVALLVSVVMDSVLVQMAVFVAVSLLTLLFTRPLVSKYVTPRQQPTNSELNVGKKAQVIRTITPNSPGRVRLEGVDWAARSAETIAEGSWCIVTACGKRDSGGRARNTPLCRFKYPYKANLRRYRLCSVIS